MKIEYPKGETTPKNCLEEKFEIKFAVVVRQQEEIRNKILLLFDIGWDHNEVVNEWLENNQGDFLGAGKIYPDRDSVVWDSSTCLRPKQRRGFGKEKPKNPKEAEKLLAKVSEKVTELLKTLQEA